MAHKIYEWSEISDNFQDSLLLGNGASIAIDDSFLYKSLKEHAIEHGLLTPNVCALFKYFKTDDFELVLRLVWQASRVNKALDIIDNKTQKAYEHVRDCLIDAVRSIHPNYSDVEHKFDVIADFMSQFKTVLSLNYDLTLYWVAMYSNRKETGHLFKDAMFYSVLADDWKKYREPYREKTNTLIFYPHGNLLLARNIIDNEFKVEVGAHDDLLTAILNRWTSESCVPLFVSEGTSNQKVVSISNSHYLSVVYREVFADLGSTLTIYGWGIGEHDVHILRRIRESNITKIAVSVHEHNQGYCNYVYELIKRELGRIEVVFFDSASKRCWVSA
ncbi:DUF4917 family protein [Pseudoalteromonas shioyasakiensis]|uniref:DUF4917 family protein n=1 Tax=Pseudoalteromonas shioyasakiensis TaxID=1190813 RepID=UPI002551F989|nr:DUF4917 family protein [Pseudoalteromonas shioyasakiensis]MDK9683222.1 DUF4917 family protein [Pseudoalteromonas shioyasakiensis]